MFAKSSDHKKIKESFLEFANSILWSNPYAVTLTLKQRVDNLAIDIMIASQNLKHFLNRLNRWFFGNGSTRFNKSIQVVPIIENNHSHINELDFDHAIRQCWLKTKWGYNHIDIQPMTDNGWIKYISKVNTKSEYDLAIDWVNLRKN